MAVTTAIAIYFLIWWLMLFAVLVGGSIYNKLGRPSLDAASSAVAGVTAVPR